MLKLYHAVQCPSHSARGGGRPGGRGQRGQTARAIRKRFAVYQLSNGTSPLEPSRAKTALDPVLSQNRGGSPFLLGGFLFNQPQQKAPSEEKKQKNIGQLSECWTTPAHLPCGFPTGQNQKKNIANLLREPMPLTSSRPGASSPSRWLLAFGAGKGVAGKGSEAKHEPGTRPHGTASTPLA